MHGFRHRNRLHTRCQQLLGDHLARSLLAVGSGVHSDTSAEVAVTSAATRKALSAAASATAKRHEDHRVRSRLVNRSTRTANGTRQFADRNRSRSRWQGGRVAARLPAAAAGRPDTYVCEAARHSHADADAGYISVTAKSLLSGGIRLGRPPAASHVPYHEPQPVTNAVTTESPLLLNLLSSNSGQPPMAGGQQPPPQPGMPMHMQPGPHGPQVHGGVPQPPRYPHPTQQMMPPNAGTPVQMVS